MTTKVSHIKTKVHTVYIGRGSSWGNIFTHLPLDKTQAEYQSPTREASIADFENWFLHSPDPRAQWMRDHVHELKGKTLGCFCAPRSCHGDVLARHADKSSDL
jgi:hypothetical protein